MNNVVIIGRVVRDPELRYLPNGGTAICNLTLAVDKGLSKEKKQQMESQGKYTADFINVVVWGKQGESVANYMTKGNQMGVQGRIQTGSYTGNDGVKKYTFDIVADRVEFLGAPGGNNSQPQNKNQASDFGDGFSPVDEDDIPF